VSAEIQAWFEDYQQKLRNEARNEGVRSVLLRQLHARFGELPTATVARVEAAELADLEQWSERVLVAQTLADVFDNRAELRRTGLAATRRGTDRALVRAGGWSARG
jgi:Domain of unknown function (DUF4351)